MLATDTGVAVRIAEFADTPLLISNANMALMTTDETNSNLCVLVIDNNEVSVLPITTDSVPVCTLQSHDGSTHILYESSHSAAACTSGSQNDISFCPMKAIKPGCKKVYGRCNFCIFCKKCLRGKISQHLLNVHKQEPSVTEINLLPKGSAKRRQLIAKLTNEGNFNHNATVLKSGKGHVVTAWRSRKNTTKVQNVMQYIPCEYCKNSTDKITFGDTTGNAVQEKMSVAMRTVQCAIMALPAVVLYLPVHFWKRMAQTWQTCSCG